MDMVINDDAIIEAIADRVVDKLMPVIDKKVEDHDRIDEFVSASYLYKHVFHMSARKFAEFQTMPGFPRNPNPGGNDTYSLKAVLKWIAENQIYS